jgi:hypothetical protein
MVTVSMVMDTAAAVRRTYRAVVLRLLKGSRKVAKYYLTKEKGVRGGFVCLRWVVLLGDTTVVYGGYEGAELQTAEHNGCGRPTRIPRPGVDNGGGKGPAFPGHGRGSQKCISAAHHLCKRTVGVGRFQSLPP